MAELPDWQSLDEVGPVDFAAGTGGGRVVGLVASEDAVTLGWAEYAALTLAKGWSEAGQKVMLVDGSLSEPRLHSVAGIANGEGFSDAALFGASVARVAQQVDDGGYFLIPAGTAVADPASVASSRRWEQLARGFVEAGVTLVMYLRDGESSTRAFLGSASDIVVLASAHQAPPASVRDLESLVRLVTGPDDGLSGEAHAAVGLDAADGAAPPDPSVSVGVRTDDLGATGVRELSADALRATASQGRSRVMILVLVAILLLVVLAAVFGIVNIPGISPSEVGATASLTEVAGSAARG